MPRVQTSEKVTVLRPSRRPVTFGLTDLWEHRHLIYLFVWRDWRARYKQTLLGALWAVLQPLLTMAVFTFVFERLAKVPSEGVSYPVFALCGLPALAVFRSRSGSVGE